MKFHVDFSLYFSPSDPYANVTGYVELASYPCVGELFQVIDESEEGPALFLRIDAVCDAGAEDSGSIALEDYVVNGRESAERLGERLDRETSYHVYVY